ncbi:MAG: Wzz/FepE/Etk N-terminal domain-containing protein [Pseudomonadota bacterium]
MLGIADFIGVLRYRRLIILWSVLVAACVATVIGFALPKSYVSAARVQVDSKQKNNLTGLFEPRVRVAEFLGQQAAIAGSRAVALNVVDQLVEDGVVSLADYEEQWREETGGEAEPGNDLRLWAADELRNKLEIKADALESTLQISYRSEDPARAARIANGFANGYMRTILEQRQRRFARTAESFSTETRSLADDVVSAQQDLAQFREKSGILPIGIERVEAEELEYGALAARLAAARADNSEAQSLMRKARSTPRETLISFPIPDDAIPARQAQMRLGAVIAQLARLSDRYGETYPDYVEAAREKRKLEQTIVDSINERADYASRRVAALEVEIDELRGQVSGIQSNRDAYALLENRVAASQETFNLVASRTLQESLQSRVDAIDVILLARAVPSSAPATPPLALITVLGAVLGLMIGTCTGVFAEFFEARVRLDDRAGKIFRTTSYGTVEMPTAMRRRRRRKALLALPRKEAA